MYVAVAVRDCPGSPRTGESNACLRLSEEDFMRVYRAADALVIPTRGEGWGRPQAEATAVGLPVITTYW
jgi:glycosyltransferase involved in cell wall biosynthesis